MAYFNKPIRNALIRGGFATHRLRHGSHRRNHHPSWFQRNRLFRSHQTAPKLEAVGLEVRIDAFHDTGRVATSGGCLSSSYLAYWVIDRLTGRAAADQALAYVVPIGEEAAYQERIDRLVPIS